MEQARRFVVLLTELFSLVQYCGYVSGQRLNTKPHFPAVVGREKPPKNRRKYG